MVTGTPGRSGISTRDSCFAGAVATSGVRSLRSSGRSLTTRCCLSASVVRVWAYAGHESTLGPALIAMVFGMASVALVVTTLAGRRAWIAGALTLGATTFLSHVSSQCADVPLACFIVVTLAVACGDVLRVSGSEIPDPGCRCRGHERHGGMDEERRSSSSRC